MSALDTTEAPPEILSELSQQATKLSGQLDRLLDRADTLAGQLDGLAPLFHELTARADKIPDHIAPLEELLQLIAAHVEPKRPYFPSSTSLKLENSRMVASGQTQLYGFSGVNTKAAAQFILVFDSNVIPANGAVPEVVLTAPASDNFWLSWAPAWRDFSNGVAICNSSTSATLTIGAADCWFDAQYLALPPA